LVLGVEATISSDVLLIFLLLKGLNSLIIGCTVVGTVQYLAEKNGKALNEKIYLITFAFTCH
jgi:hypothetical protein